jgi:hypothetical protein
MTDTEVLAYIQANYHVAPDTGCWLWDGPLCEWDAPDWLDLDGVQARPCVALHAMATGVDLTTTSCHRVTANIRCNHLCINPNHGYWQEWPVVAVVPAPKPLKPKPVFPPTVYFIQAGDTGPIKIGHTTTGVDSRLASLQTGSPVLLRCIATTSGSVRDEQSLHARFQAARLHGEWFAPSDALLAYIHGLQPPIAQHQYVTPSA